MRDDNKRRQVDEAESDTLKDQDFPLLDFAKSTSNETERQVENPNLRSDCRHDETEEGNDRSGNHDCSTPISIG